MSDVATKHQCLDKKCRGNIDLVCSRLGSHLGYCIKCKKDYFIDEYDEIYFVPHYDSNAPNTSLTAWGRGIDARFSADDIQEALDYFEELKRELEDA